MPSQGGALQAIGLNLPQICINRTHSLAGKLLQTVISTTILEWVSDCRSGLAREGLNYPQICINHTHSLASKLLQTVISTTILE